MIIHWVHFMRSFADTNLWALHTMLLTFALWSLSTNWSTWFIVNNRWFKDNTDLLILDLITWLLLPFIAKVIFIIWLATGIIKQRPWIENVSLSKFGDIRFRGHVNCLILSLSRFGRCFILFSDIHMMSVVSIKLWLDGSLMILKWFDRTSLPT